MIESKYVFTFGKMIQFKYQDEDSASTMLTMETTKGEQKLMLSKSKLIIYSCEPVELQKNLTDTKNFLLQGRRHLLIEMKLPNNAMPKIYTTKEKDRPT